MKPAQSPLVTQIKAARRVSVPLVAITTPDPADTVRVVCEAINGETPKVVWDVVEGLRPRGTTDAGVDASKEAIVKMLGGGGTNDAGADNTVGNPIELMRVARRLPEKGVIFVHLANRWVGDPSVMQGAWNLRDEFKLDRRMMILLGPDMPLPPEKIGRAHV